MVAASHGAKLALGRGLEALERLAGPCRVVEEFVIDARLVRAAHAEGNVANDVVHDALDLWRNILRLRICADRKVAAGDVESDAGDGNLVLVGDDASDRLSIALVPIGAQDAADATSG